MSSLPPPVPIRTEDLPPASLVICTRGRPQMLRETVESVLAGDHLPAEIVIIDQSAEPHADLPELGTCRMPAGECRIVYRHSASVGLCRARNEGIASASTDWLAFIDDDMYVETDWFRALIGSLARSALAVGSGADPAAPLIITGRVLPAQDLPGGFVPALASSDQPRAYAGRIGTDVLAAGHMAMRRATYQAIGPFDERLGAGSRYPAADDNDYGLRLLEAGGRILYEPRAVVYHRAWRPQSEYHRMRWSYGRGKGGFYRKYASLRDPYLLKRAAADVLLRLVRFPWRALHRRDLAVGDLYYVAGILSGAWEWSLRERGPRDPALYPPPGGSR